MQNNFRIIKKIYQSQRTEVYRAIREVDSLSVILKTRSGLVSVEPEAGLAREYEIGKTLGGRQTVKCQTLEHFAQKTILVFQDESMHSLQSVVPEGGFDLSDFFTIALEIVSAIEGIHLQNVIHRDINPTNIIVNSSLNAIKLIDFEQATRISGEMVGFEPIADLQGTIPFISPEQTGRINKPVDSRSDLYSLGITFYRLITGKLPFDATDPGELIYSHIARKPVPVYEIRQDIPQVVSGIIAKLMNKSPYERYQTATCLKKDIQYIQEAIRDGKKIVDFRPGRDEQPGRITLIAKLYGREKETSLLLDCFNNCSSAGQLVTVTGPAGIGKTALIRELYTPITAQKGFFLSGKFDQLNKGLAYTALAEVLKDFVHQCFGQDEETLEIWKTAIQSSVGEFGQVLTDIVSEFEILIGKQQKIAPVSPLESIDRRNLVFSNLIKDICSIGRPIVVFLDDMQWTDFATLSLLETIIDISPKNLLILLSYRDNEISMAHPVKLFLDNINSKGSEFINLHLDSLNEQAVNDWMNDILPEARKDAGKLAVQVMAKTEGNPFYIASFLNMFIEKKYIKNHADGTVSLDVDAITNISADANIVKHLVRKIESLEPEYRKFLTQVSILGNRFSLEAISLCLGEKNTEYQDVLQKLVGAHLLVKSGDTIMFAHDKVQQAARALLDDSKADNLHLQAGRNIRDSYKAHNLAEKHIEQYIYHFNAAADLITDAVQRLELARLNTMLGKRLKNNAAYQAAEKSFAQAIAFLPPNPFETDYAMAIDLYTEYGEALFLNLKYEEGEKQFETVIVRSKSPLDSAKVYVKQIAHYAAQHRLEKSMKIALRALETLGVKLPKRMLKITTILNLFEVKYMLKNTKPEDILGFPVSEDPLVLAQMEVLSVTAATAYMAYPDFFPTIAFRMMKISIAKGNCSISPFAYMCYAIIIGSIGDADMGYSYGRAALALMEKLNVKQLSIKLNYIFGAFIHHWKEAARDSVDFFKTAQAGGLETGDYEYASYAANKIMYYSPYFGKSIDSLLSQYHDQHKIIAEFGKEQTTFLSKYWHQLLITMNDLDGDGTTVSGEIIDEKILIPLLEERQELTSLGFCMIGKMQLSYLAGKYDLAKSVQGRAVELTRAMAGDMFIPIGHFFSALTCVAYYRNHVKKSSLLREARRSLKKLKKWGTNAPDNYLYKAQLVEAELLSVKGKENEALKLYEAAITNAQMAGNNLDLGIAYECMGRHLISIGFESLGLMQIHRSISVFHNWGALNKSNRLSKEFNIAIGKNGLLPDSTGSINFQLELESLAGTIKSLTSDLKFDSLLATLLNAVMQSSGATRVVYIHVDRGNWHVKAEKQASGCARIIEGMDSRPVSFGLPVALLAKCLSGFGEYVLENIRSEIKSCENEQQESRSKSILILPLKRQSSVKGLVYLENDLMEDAFREDKVQFLSLLAGQAAITMEKTLVFEALSESEAKWRSLTKNSPDTIMTVDLNGVIQFINRTVEKVSGDAEVLGTSVYEYVPPEQADIVRNALGRVFETGILECYQTAVKNLEDSVVEYYETRIGPVFDGKTIVAATLAGRDITKHKQIEEKLKTSLKEKEILLKEVHHRVKNNMQVISSLLKLQSDKIKDKKYADMFKESRDRIKSMTLVHEKLYQTASFAKIDFKEYVKSLVNSLFRAYGINPDRITLGIDVEDVSLGLENAIPCGLIINELVSNSLKYAFPGNRDGEIRIALNSINEDKLVLEVSDNGIGMPRDLDIRNTESIGLHLVTILSEYQLEGKIELNRVNGTLFHIKFKKQIHKERI